MFTVQFLVGSPLYTQEIPLYQEEHDTFFKNLKEFVEYKCISYSVSNQPVNARLISIDEEYRGIVEVSVNMDIETEADFVHEMLRNKVLNDCVSKAIDGVINEFNNNESKFKYLYLEDDNAVMHYNNRKFSIEFDEDFNLPKYRVCYFTFNRLSHDTIPIDFKVV